MSGSSSLRRQGENAVDDPPWSPEEVAMLASAARRAPSVHNTQPWSLDVRGRTATLRELKDPELSWHDPDGRDRRISCGAALTNLVLAVRRTGWAAKVRREHSEDRPDVAATVLGSRREEPTATEDRRHRAIARRASYRRVFDSRELSATAREALLAAASSSVVRARWVAGQREALAVGRLLAYAASVRHRDHEYQRELSMWTVEHSVVEQQSGRGLQREALGIEGLPAVGLVTSATQLPDERRLASWIERKSVLVLSTPTDDPDDRLRTGEAMETAWLEATSSGLVVSVMTQPLHLSEVRHNLAEQLGLSGTPHMLMRFGHRAVAGGPSSSRRPLS